MMKLPFLSLEQTAVKDSSGVTMSLVEGISILFSTLKYPYHAFASVYIHPVWTCRADSPVLNKVASLAINRFLLKFLEMLRPCREDARN
jgi:hypothetical protein